MADKIDPGYSTAAATDSTRIARAALRTRIKAARAAAIASGADSFTQDWSVLLSTGYAARKSPEWKLVDILEDEMRALLR